MRPEPFGPAERAAAERGGIVIGWLMRLVVMLAIVALAAYEGGAVIVAHVQSDTAATDVSEEAALAYAHSNDADQARAVADAKATSEGAVVVAFSIDAARKNITVTVEKTARTLFLQRMSFSRKWTDARTTRTQPIPS